MKKVFISACLLCAAGIVMATGKEVFSTNSIHENTLDTITHGIADTNTYHSKVWPKDTVRYRRGTMNDSTMHGNNMNPSNQFNNRDSMNRSNNPSHQMNNNTDSMMNRNTNPSGQWNNGKTDSSHHQ